MRSHESWPKLIIGALALTMMLIAMFAWAWILEGILQ